MSNFLFTHFTDYASDNTSVLLRGKPLAYNKSFSFTTKKEDDQVVIDTISSLVHGDVSKIPSTEFYSFWSRSARDNYPSIHSSVLNSSFPICVRYKSEKCVVIERPPFKVPVRMNYRKSSSRWGKKSKNQSNFNEEIWIPWTVVVLTFPNGMSSLSSTVSSSNNFFHVSLYFRSAPLTSFDDSLVLPYTPNVYTDGRICLGESFADFYQQINDKSLDITNISQVYQYITAQYFSGGWNLDLGLAGLDYSVYDVLFNETYMSYIYDKAVQADNKYILSAFKQHGKNLDIRRSFSEKSRIRFIFSFLSCLDLQETLQFVNSVFETDQYINSKNPRSYRHSLTLKKVLDQQDASFRFNYDFYHETNEDELRDSLLEIEEQYVQSIFRLCLSSANNSLALHSWKIEILLNTQDFLNYASNRMLSYYCDNSYRPINREDFYKKNIAFAILKEEYSWYIGKLYSDYFNDLNEKFPELKAYLKDAIISLSDYYHDFTEGSYTNKFVLNLTEKNILLDKSLLEEEVVTS